jgi:hypothetical protein
MSMRVAAILIVIAAAVAAPVVARAASPHMSQADFLRAVQCTAYDSLAQFSRESPGAARNRALLRAEAHEQGAGTARAAQRLAARVAREGAAADESFELAALRAARASACGETEMAGDEHGASS